MQLMRGYKKWKQTSPGSAKKTTTNKAREKRIKAREQAQDLQKNVSKDQANGDGLRKLCKDFNSVSSSVRIEHMRQRATELDGRREGRHELISGGFTSVRCEGKPILCAIVAGLFASSKQWKSIASGGETLSDRMALLHSEFSANVRPCDSAYKFVQRISKANSSRTGRELESLREALFPLVDIVVFEWDRWLRIVKSATNNPKCAAVLFLAHRRGEYFLLHAMLPPRSAYCKDYLLPRSKVPAYLYA